MAIAPTKFLNANNATTTLAGSISNSATTLNVAAGTGVRFPAPSAGEYFVMTLRDAATSILNEIVWVTNVTGDTMTVIRAREGTTALAWAANDLADQLWTSGQAQALLQLGQSQTQAANYAVDTGIANAYLCALTPSITAPVSGMPVRVLWANNNTGASTLDAGTGPIAIRRIDDSALIGNEIVAGIVGTVIYSATTTHWHIQQVAPATAAAISGATDGESFVTPAQLGSAVSSLPSGSVSAYLGAAAPSGWLLCYGQAINRTTYSVLFALFGTTFGIGDGSTTFNLPDLRGRVIAGADNMGGVAANRLGSGSTGGITVAAVFGVGGGEQSHTQITSEMPAHTHTYSGPTGATGAGSGGPVAGVGTTTASSSTGGGAAMNVTQPTLVLNYIVKT